jgi:hypothetical protein
MTIEDHLLMHGFSPSFENYDSKRFGQRANIYYSQFVKHSKNNPILSRDYYMLHLYCLEMKTEKHCEEILMQIAQEHQGDGK